MKINEGVIKGRSVRQRRKESPMKESELETDENIRRNEMAKYEEGRNDIDLETIEASNVCEMAAAMSKQCINPAYQWRQIFNQ